MRSKILIRRKLVNKMKYAVIRIRGRVDVRKKLEDTMKMLNLDRIYRMIIVDDKKIPMIKKVKDFVTWGEVSDDFINKLKSKRKEIKKNVFALNPPRKGLKSSKLPFPKGSLGYRKEKIQDLIERMW